MRLARMLGVGIVAAGLIYAFPAAQEQADADRKVSGGGVTAKGWQGRADTGNRQGLTIKDSKFAPEGSGFRLMTGPAAFYWNPANAAKGDFTVKATFSEAKQSYNHPHPFGVFIGGSGLDGDAPNALYCVAYRDGTFLVRQFVAGKPTTLAKKNAHESVAKASGPEAAVKQEVGWTVKGDRAECMINGAAVWSGTRADLGNASLDGLTGIRVSHNSDALVSNFTVSK